MIPQQQLQFPPNSQGHAYFIQSGQVLLCPPGPSAPVLHDANASFFISVFFFSRVCVSSYCVQFLLLLDSGCKGFVTLPFSCCSTVRRTFTRRSSIQWPARQQAFTQEPIQTTAPRMVRSSTAPSTLHPCPSLHSSKTGLIGAALRSTRLTYSSFYFYTYACFLSCLTLAGSVAASCAVEIFLISLSFTFYSFFYSLTFPLWAEFRGRSGSEGEAGGWGERRGSREQPSLSSRRSSHLPPLLRWVWNATQGCLGFKSFIVFKFISNSQHGHQTLNYWKIVPVAFTRRPTP